MSRTALAPGHPRSPRPDFSSPPAKRSPVEEIINAPRSWAETNPGHAVDWKHAGADHPNRGHVWKCFGSWDAALRAAGLSSPEPA